MSDNFGKTIENWYNKVESASKLTTADIAKITGAGAKVYAEILKANTPVGKNRHVYKSKRRKTKHLKNTITYKNGFTADNINNGNTDVGFSGKYYDFVARITNNGKKVMSAKEMKNLHFMDKALEQARPKIIEAEKREYSRIINGS